MEPHELQKSYFIYKDIVGSKYYNAAVKNILEGKTKSDVEKYSWDANLLDEADAVQHEIENDQTLMLASVFPERELADSMKSNGVDNVDVAMFLNGRENGNAYTVVKPDGSKISFSVYQHRNSDDMIINAIDDWDGVQIPYMGDKHEYAARYEEGDYKSLADGLATFLKDAQEGKIKRAEDLNMYQQNSPTS